MPQLTGLRRARERRLMTIRDLAAASGVGPSTILRLEKHGQEAHMVTARKLAQALGVAPDELLGEELEGIEAAA